MEGENEHSYNCTSARQTGASRVRDIVLASSSPRRRQLLEAVGLTFRVDAVSFPEKCDETMKPAEIVRRLSLEKARLGAQRNRDAIVIAADTIGVLDGRVIGKPKTQSAAVEMLREMRGRCHTVVTGYTVMDSRTGRVATRSVETTVRIKELSDEEIEAYVRTGEPMDKAGAYGIQGLGAILVSRIEGDYFNVVGLPLSALAETLKDFGVNLLLSAKGIQGKP